MNSHTILGRLCLDSLYRAKFFLNPAQALADHPLPLLAAEQDALLHLGTDQPLADQLQEKFQQIGQLLAAVGCTHPPCPWPKAYMVILPPPPPPVPQD